MISVPLTEAGSTAYGIGHPITGATVVQLTVANASVEIQLGYGVGGQRWQEGDSFRIPGVHVIPGPADAIRVRSKLTHAGDDTDPWPQYSVDAY